MSDFSQFATEIVTEIQMSHSNRKWLILEGDTDEKIFLARPLSSVARTVVAKGWENVLYVVTSCDDFERKVVLGLIDRDYRDFDSSQPSHSNLVITDYRDIENILFESNALVRVYTEYGSRTKLPCDHCGSLDYSQIRDVLSKVAIRLGRFRAYCHKHQIAISFKEIEHTKFVDDRTLQLNSSAFLRHLKGNPDNNGIEIDSHWNSSSGDWLPESLNTPVLVRHGHDLMAMVAVSLRRKWGTHGGRFDRKEIEKLFRLAIDDTELRSFEFWKNIDERLAAT